MSAPRCRNCRWWDASVTDATNEELSPCRVNPPIVPINMRQGAWPMVDADDWCGSHVERPKPAPDPNHTGQPDCNCFDCIPF